MSPTVAPVGIDSECAIPHLSAPSRLGNIANVVLCGVSLFFVAYLISVALRRKAAVGADTDRSLCGCLLMIRSPFFYFPF